MDRFPTQTLEDTGRGGIVQQTILPSGLKIITETVPTVRSAAVGYWVATGSRDEEKPEAGAAHFLEHLLFKGTPTRTAMEISSSLEAVGLKEGTITYKPYLGKDMVLEVRMNGKKLKAGDKVLKSSKIDLVLGDGKPNPRVAVRIIIPV